MLILLSGVQLPFILLAFCLFGSYVCASIIANDENCANPPITCTNENIKSESNHRNHIRTTKLSKSMPAFIEAPCKGIFSKISNKKLKIKNNHEMSILKQPPSSLINHYVCPPTSLEALRKRYGTNQDYWGDWNAAQTRSFYKQQLPKALQIDGALGLSLQQRAEIASANRHALRLYCRERCHLPARMIAKLYDGVRHLHVFGTWKSDGMDWSEVKQKYAMEAKAKGYESEEEILLFVYERIVERASVTNALFDEISNSKKTPPKDRNQIVFSVMKSIYDAPKIQQSIVSTCPSDNSSELEQPKFSFKLSTINSVIPKLFSMM